jgi:60 kDa SS-A/Ro ribonucleoprotein
MSGGTDLALPVRAALALKEPVDLIQIYTDSETWAGHQHLDTVLEEYRATRNPQVKLVIAAMTANRISVGDPQDPAILQAIGFDASLPQVIAAFAGGDSSAEVEECGR